MDSLSNELLIEAYSKAQQLQLDEDFIVLLKEEINRRGLQTKYNLFSI
ncbi:sporulation histidine kinase inhibitor Sda [Aquibacillus sediminis]|nr:sporulation histidine kinase inhibitor Sda [Aquibacillus sediminis]